MAFPSTTPPVSSWTLAWSSSTPAMRGDAEVRLKAVGLIEGKLFVVVFADRSEARRIISARRANTKERRAYDPVHPQSE